MEPKYLEPLHILHLEEVYLKEFWIIFIVFDERLFGGVWMRSCPTITKYGNDVKLLSEKEAG